MQGVCEEIARRLRGDTGDAHLRPVGANEMEPTSCSVRKMALQSSHFSSKMQPCSTASFSRGSPARWSRPSTFCVTTKCALPNRTWLGVRPFPLCTSSTSARCVSVGAAVEKSIAPLAILALLAAAPLANSLGPGSAPAPLPPAPPPAPPSLFALAAAAPAGPADAASAAWGAPARAFAS
eukprot:scaffold25756_cov66-Phaeocystis_antarctica.AAC.2